MRDLTRRQVLAGAAALAAAGLAAPARAQTPKRGGTLRFIPIGDLKILDPIWTTAYITRDHGYMVCDTLFATDANLQIKPQMVDKYTVSRDGMKYAFTLRDGLRFHDGPPVTAEDCVASLIRWGKRDPLGKLMFAADRQAAGDGQEDVRARAEGAVRAGAGGARQAVQQRAVHHAGPAGRHAGRTIK